MSDVNKKVSATISADPAMFVIGLDKAIGSTDSLMRKMMELDKEIDKFGAKSVTAKIEADVTSAKKNIDETKLELDKIGRTIARASVSLDDTNMVKKALLDLELLDKLDKQKALPEVDLKGFLQAELQIRSLRDQMDALDKKTNNFSYNSNLGPTQDVLKKMSDAANGIGKGGDNNGGGLAGMLGPLGGAVSGSPMIAAGAILSPTLAPLLAATTALLAGFTGAAATAAIGAAPLLVLFKSSATALTKAGTALQAYDKVVQQHGANSKQAASALATYNYQIQELGPGADKAALAMYNFQQAFQNFQGQNNKYVFPLITLGLQSIIDLLPKLQPLIAASSTAFTVLLTALDKGINSTGFKDFINFIAANAGPAILAFGKSIGNLVEGVGHMIVAFKPFTDWFEGAMVSMFVAFNNWSAGLATSPGFHSFVDYAMKSLPEIGNLFMSLVNFIGTFLTTTASAGLIVVPALTGIVNILSDMMRILGPAITGVVEGLKLIGDALNYVSGGQAVTAVLALVAGFVAMKVAAALANVEILAMGRGLLVLAADKAAETLASAWSALVSPIGLASVAIGALAIGFINAREANSQAQKQANDYLDTLTKLNVNGAKSVDDVSKQFLDQYNQLKQLNDEYNVFNTLKHATPQAANGDPTNYTGIHAAITQFIDDHKRAGESEQQFIDEIQGSGPKLAALQGNYENFMGNLSALNAVYGLSASAAMKLADVNHINLGGSLKDVLSGFADMKASAAAANDPTLTLAKNAATLADQFANATDKASALKDMLDQIAGKKISYEDSLIKFNKGILDLGTSLDKTSNSLDIQTVAGIKNMTTFEGIANTIIAGTKAEYDHTGSVQKASDAWNSHIATLNAAAAKMGFTKDQIAFMNTTLGLTPDALAGIDGAMSTTQEKVAADTAKIQANLLETSKKAGDAGAQAGSNFGQYMQMGIRSKQQSVIDAAGNMSLAAKQTAFDNADGGLAGRALAQSTANNIIASENLTDDAARRLMYGAEAAAYGTTQATGLAAIGVNFVTGIAQGMLSAAGQANAAAAQIVALAHASANNQLQAHSPSKLLADTTGKWFVQGFAQGILQNMAIAQTAAAQMINAAVITSQQGGPQGLAQLMNNANAGKNVGSYGITSAQFTQARINSAGATWDQQKAKISAANSTLQTYNQTLATNVKTTDTQYAAIAKQMAVQDAANRSYQTRMDAIFHSGKRDTATMVVNTNLKNALAAGQIKLAALTTQLLSVQHTGQAITATLQGQIDQQQSQLATMQQGLADSIYKDGLKNATNAANDLLAKLSELQARSDGFKSSFANNVLGSVALTSIMGSQAIPTSIAQASMGQTTPTDYVGNIVAGLKSNLIANTRFSATVGDLTNKGLNQDYLQQIVDIGAQGGQAVATALDNASQSQLNEINKLYQGTVDLAAHGMDNMAAQLYSNGANAIGSLITGIASQWPELQSLIQQVNTSLASIGNPNAAATASAAAAAASSAGLTQPSNTTNKTAIVNLTTQEITNAQNISNELAWILKGM